MEGLRQYVISVTTAAIVCGMLTAVLKKGTMQSLVKLLCGFFLAFTFLNPIGKLELKALPENWALDYQAASDAAQEGERYARNSLAEIIKEQTEAYILDKAAALKANLTVEVTVSGSGMPVPTAAKYRGEVPADVRQQLETIVQTELGIARENQTWIG